jgi:hypothetical protein
MLCHKIGVKAWAIHGSVQMIETSRHSSLYEAM